MLQTDIVSLVRSYGGVTTDALLDAKCEKFFMPGIDGFIGYRKKMGACVVLGDPVASFQDQMKLALGFQAFALKHNWQVIYLIVTDRFKTWAMQEITHASIEFGKLFYLDPNDNPYHNSGDKGSLVRRKVKQAINHGIVLEEYTTKHGQIEEAVDQVTQDWLSRNKSMLHISYHFLFENTFGKRWFLARHHQEIVGVVLLSALNAEKGWLMNHLMVKEKAPNGTPEFLVVKTLEILAQEGCHYVTFGASPETELGEICGVASLLDPLYRSMYRGVKHLLRFDGLKMFWGKFKPKESPTYLLFDKKGITVKSFIGILNALNLGD